VLIDPIECCQLQQNAGLRLTQTRCWAEWGAHRLAFSIETQSYMLVFWSWKRDPDWGPRFEVIKRLSCLSENATFAFVKERYFRVVDEARHPRFRLKCDPRFWSEVRVFEALSSVIFW